MKLRMLLLTLALCGLAARDASAQANLHLDRVGGAIGYVSPEHLGGAFGLGVFADLGTIAPRIGLEARLDYWSSSEEFFGAKTSVSDIAVGARGKYYFPVPNSQIRPYAGGGLAFHVVHAEVTIPPMPGIPADTYGDSQTKLGLDLGGGAAMGVGPRTDLLGEIWYGIVSDVSQFSMRVGLSYKLGQ
jgi:opacity protein-like surface antigen